MKFLATLTTVTFLIGCGQNTTSNEKPGKVAGPKGAIIESGFVSETELNTLQDDPVNRWQHLDLDEDKLFGVSSQKAYREFDLQQKKSIVVAVIDSGVDYTHPDLKGNMWVNINEIPGNGKDDDGNGYIDDIYGWNFLGGADGRNISAETLEYTRIYKTLLTRISQGESLNKSDQALFEEVKDLVETELAKQKKIYDKVVIDNHALNSYLAVIQAKLGIESFTSKNEIDALPEEDPQIKNIKEKLLLLWKKYWKGFSGLKRKLENSSYYVNAGLNINYNGRAEIIGDDPSDFTDISYGNNDVKGPDASHGTHVAGTIAASRDNGVGIDGIAANVKIMALRAVPNGDERDKDIALAVRYAVDNGAHIINMSFGKSYSPYKAQVDAAFEYAASKGVLLVHAAGNSSKNIDGGKNSFPNSYKLAKVYRVNTIPNWIEVASNSRKLSPMLPSSFTNYGKEAASLFAPGHKIFSTTPGNKYASFSGTSMACPVTAGVAALLMSEFSHLDGAEVKDILIQTVSKPKDLTVLQPGGGFSNSVLFETLSESEGVLNAYKAVEMALQL